MPLHRARVHVNRLQQRVQGYVSDILVVIQQKSAQYIDR